MTASTRGYRSRNCWPISAARRPIAASTSAALETRSEFSRNAQDSRRSAISAVPLGEEGAEFLAHLAVAQAEFHRCLQVTQLAAAVVALAADAHRQHALAGEQRRDCVGELNFSPAPRLRG